MNRRLQILLLASFAASSCDRPAEPHEPDPVVTPAPALVDAGSSTDTALAPDLPLVEAWRTDGRLLGFDDEVAYALTDGIETLRLQSGEVRATAVTSGTDPRPSFDDLLPRLGQEPVAERDVARLGEQPVFFHDGTVAYFRGYEGVVTSLVGLVGPDLEEKWSYPVGLKEPIQTCAAASGILLVPALPEPARFVDWDGKQRWQRLFGHSDETVIAVVCKDEAVTVTLDRKRDPQCSFATDRGDLVACDDAVSPNHADSAGEDVPTGGRRITQEGPMIVGRTRGPARANP